MNITNIVPVYDSDLIINFLVNFSNIKRTNYNAKKAK